MVVIGQPQVMHTARYVKSSSISGVETIQFVRVIKAPVDIAVDA